MGANEKDIRVSIHPLLNQGAWSLSQLTPRKGRVHPEQAASSLQG